jgi:hypothetical protein
MKIEDVDNLSKIVGAVLQKINETNVKTLENNRMLRVLLSPAQLKKAEVENV